MQKMLFVSNNDVFFIDGSFDKNIDNLIKIQRYT